MEIRPEKPEDINAIYQVNVAVFGRKSEADLADRLRGECLRFPLWRLKVSKLLDIFSLAQ